MTRRLGIGIAVVSWLAIAALTLTPGSGSGSDGSPWCLACGPGWAADMVANVLLFIPLGVGLALWGVGARRALVLVALTTFCIELLQIRIVHGRDASLSDLLTNLLGGTAGYLGVRYRTAVLKPPPRRAALLALTWSLVWLGGTATTAWALTPSVPASLWWAHWQTPKGERGIPANSPLVLDATLAGVPITPGAVTAWPTLRPRLLQGAGMSVRTVLPGDPTDVQPDIARVDDADTESDLVRMSRHGNGVTFYFRTRVVALRLRPPAIASGDFLSSARNDTVAISGALADGRLRIHAERPGRAVTRSLALSPDWGWSFLLPDGYAFGSEVRLLTAFWITALVLPIAYFGRRAAARHGVSTRSLVVAALALPPLGLILIPMSFHLPAVHWSEWLAWAAGSALGLALANSRTVHA